MKTYRPTTGPYREALHFEQDEIETICADALTSVNLLPTAPAPIRIDRFLEKKFRITPEYDTLDPGCLGYTDFSSNGPTRVVISTELSNDTRTPAQRRLRTTLAHEAGHCLLHPVLYFDTGQTSLLDTSRPKLFMCRDEDIGVMKRQYIGKWYEYQANLAMSSLLLPKALTFTALDPHLSTTRLGGKTLQPHDVDEAITTLSQTFDVNPVVVRIRIETLLKITIT